MTYTTKTLAKIGRIVIKQHPDIATGIIEQWPKPMDYDLSKLPGYLNQYCELTGAEKEDLKGEAKRIFISAMLNIYTDQRLFKKTISIALIQDLSYTCRMVEEVQFRYRKDQDFKDKVNHILTLITHTS